MKWATRVTAGGILTLLLAGCAGSGGGSEPTQGPSAPTTEVPTTEDSQACGYGHASNTEVEVTLGEAEAASDEWAESIGREWRHFLPLTVTNLTDAACIFSVYVRADVDGEDAGYDEAWVPLRPGQSFRGQLFDLENMMDFSQDAEHATYSADLTTDIQVRKHPLLYDYYDLDTEVQGVTGDGANAAITVEITVNGTTEGMPGRIGSATKDNLEVVGIDAEGIVVTLAGLKIDPIPDGNTGSFTLPVGGGYSGGDSRRVMPASAYDEVVSWEVYLEPELNQDSQVG